MQDPVASVWRDIGLYDEGLVARGANQDSDKSAETVIWTHETRPQGETQDASSQLVLPSDYAR